MRLLLILPVALIAAFQIPFSLSFSTDPSPILSIQPSSHSVPQVSSDDPKAVIRAGRPSERSNGKQRQLSSLPRRPPTFTSWALSENWKSFNPLLGLEGVLVHKGLPDPLRENVHWSTRSGKFGRREAEWYNGVLDEQPEIIGSSSASTGEMVALWERDGNKTSNATDSSSIGEGEMDCGWVMCDDEDDPDCVEYDDTDEGSEEKSSMAEYQPSTQTDNTTNDGGGNDTSGDNADIGGAGDDSPTGNSSSSSPGTDGGQMDDGSPGTGDESSNDNTRKREVVEASEVVWNLWFGPGGMFISSSNPKSFEVSTVIETEVDMPQEETIISSLFLGPSGLVLSEHQSLLSQAVVSEVLGKRDLKVESVLKRRGKSHDDKEEGEGKDDQSDGDDESDDGEEDGEGDDEEDDDDQGDEDDGDEKDKEDEEKEWSSSKVKEGTGKNGNDQEGEKGGVSEADEKDVTQDPKGKGKTSDSDVGNDDDTPSEQKDVLRGKGNKGKGDKTQETSAQPDEEGQKNSDDADGSDEEQNNDSPSFTKSKSPSNSRNHAITSTLKHISSTQSPTLTKSNQPTQTASEASSDCSALNDLYDSLSGQSWSNQTGWISGSDCCTWFGVTCGPGGKVEKLDLVENGLEGTIPDCLFSLQSLITLDLSSNSLSFSNSNKFDHLTHLVHLTITNSTLSGQIPSSLLQHATLQILNLANNVLSGSASFTSTTLDNVNLAHNQLTAVDLTSATGLERLNVGYNQLSGSIQLEGLGKLVYFDGSFNSTSLPNLTLPSLQHLDLRSNLLIGPIPDLSSLSSLTTLYLGNNSLSLSPSTPAPAKLQTCILLPNPIDPCSPPFVPSSTSPYAPYSITSSIPSINSPNVMDASPISMTSSGGSGDIDTVSIPSPDLGKGLQDQILPNSDPHISHPRSAGESVSSMYPRLGSGETFAHSDMETRENQQFIREGGGGVSTLVEKCKIICHTSQPQHITVSPLPGENLQPITNPNQISQSSQSNTASDDVGEAGTNQSNLPSGGVVISSIANGNGNENEESKQTGTPIGTSQTGQIGTMGSSGKGQTVMTNVGINTEVNEGDPGTGQNNQNGEPSSNGYVNDNGGNAVKSEQGGNGIPGGTGGNVKNVPVYIPSSSVNLRVYPRTMIFFILFGYLGLL
ncbi:hypothetical protein M231_07967 [Tremella mesenterica]|uniref:Uncharacterized protein n=1 Tax=Tremella mesenterica TaxID=5217 RepID=A0A4Q1BDC8_TREME|nr:hypothetical protein M231_07967 [Tremella mesenterica]